MSYRRKLQRGELRDDGALLSKAEIARRGQSTGRLWVGAAAWTNGFSEWIGHRGAFASDAIAGGGSVARSHTEYPDDSHEAEELYLPLAGHAFWRSVQSC